ncbi:acyl carrier protein [Streptomyces sp. NEAU-sy36]|uniref:acyl carrier protein n=1 Tax=unclassified Streptomyces TaxID=2593676 RepID=UPI0015D575AC|nr:MULTISPECIES: acyl carrier protein [unclassified Streptomyces]QLJ03742.1 acyl carrier protein [Streptomyces sp. NEAU-sy36]
MSQTPGTENGADRIPVLWAEVLGTGSDPNLGFLENGGDSFRALTLSTMIHEETGIEVDFLDILESENAHALRERVRSAADSS